MLEDCQYSLVLITPQIFKLNLVSEISMILYRETQMKFVEILKQFKTIRELKMEK